MNINYLKLFEYHHGRHQQIGVLPSTSPSEDETGAKLIIMNYYLYYCTYSINLTEIEHTTFIHVEFRNDPFDIDIGEDLCHPHSTVTHALCTSWKYSSMQVCISRLH